MSCGGRLHVDASVTERRAIARGWLAVGEARLTEVACSTFGQMFSAINALVPIEVAEYPCPSCKSTDHLAYRVVSIEKANDAYELAAECNRRNILKRVLDQLGRSRR
jgi:hypothetical protein